MSWFDVYLITRLESIKMFCLILMIAGGFATGVIGLWGGIEEEWDRAKRYFWKFMWGSIAAGLLFCLVPTTKEAAAIYLIPKIANNEQVQQLPDNLLRFVNAYLKELTPDEKTK